MKKKKIFTDYFSLGDSNLTVKKKISKSETWIYHLLPADVEVPQMETEKNDQPFLALKIIIIFVFFILFSKLYVVQIKTGGENRQIAEGNRVRSITLPAPRGVIYDRNGVVLVKNIPNFDVVIVPADLSSDQTEKETIFKALESTIGIPRAEIIKEIESKGSKYPLPIILKTSIDRNTSLILESRIAGLKGVYVQVNPVREYMDNGLMSHILGYTGRISEEEYKDNIAKYEMTDYIGKTGLEYSYENFLKGINGKARLEIDSTGKAVKSLADVKPKNGDNLVLSIDFNLEKKMAESLRAGIDKAKVTKGVAIAMNPKNGEVLGMVSLPSYDNNLFAKGISDSDYQKLLNNKDNPLLFRAVSGQYPSGSIIKPFIAAGALQEGTITENSTVNSTGGIKVGEWEFPDWKAGGHGVTNVIKALAESVNTFFYAVGGGYQNIRGMGPEKSKEYLKRFGFDNTTGIDVPGEMKGNIPDPAWKQSVKGESWYLGDTYHMAIGEGDLLVTPLQMVNALSSIANGGTLYKPRTVDKILGSDGNTKEVTPSEVLRKDFISNSNLDVVRRGMRQCVLAGSCRALSNLPVPVAGKTGTAQYSNDLSKKHAWFEAYGPYDDPSISIVVLVEEGGEGSDFAEPVADDILKWYFENNSKVKN